MLVGKDMAIAMLQSNFVMSVDFNHKLNTFFALVHNLGPHPIMYNANHLL